MRIPKTLHGKAKAALKEAVREVIEHHKQTGRPLAIWQNGKLTWVSANRLFPKSRHFEKIAGILSTKGKLSRALMEERAKDKKRDS